MNHFRFWIAAVLFFAAGCAGAPAGGPGQTAPAVDAVVPIETWSGGEVRIGEPAAVAVDFENRVLIADASPGRLLRWSRAGSAALEFQRPAAGFFPSDLAVSGFFVYAVDEAARTVLRFDDQGAYRDILINFERAASGRRVTPYALAVDAAGRVAVTDIENHQVLVYDAYLSLEVAFGNYGSYEGQLSNPRGVAFTGDGNIVVADTGNRRVQVFSDGGAFLRAVPAAGSPNPLRRPRRAAALGGGRIAVADPEAGAVFLFGPGGTLDRSLVPAGSGDFIPSDVERGRAGHLLVTDEASRSVIVFKGD